MRFKFLTQLNNEWGINELRVGILTATSFIPKPRIKKTFFIVLLPTKLHPVVRALKKNSNT
jgi:hypothetical protein